MLARGTARVKEIAIRIAIGSSRWQLVRQFLTESLLLALVGGAAGLGVAYAGVQFLSSVHLPSDFALSFGVRMDARLLVFGFTVAIVTGLACGLLPALRFSRADLSSIIKASDSGPAKAFWRGRLAGRNVLVTAQLALSVVLLIVSAFFVRGFDAARRLDPGFRLDHTLFFTLNPGMMRYDEAKARDFYRKLETACAGRQAFATWRSARRFPSAIRKIAAGWWSTGIRDGRGKMRRRRGRIWWTSIIFRSWKRGSCVAAPSTSAIRFRRRAWRL